MMTKTKEQRQHKKLPTSPEKEVMWWTTGEIRFLKENWGKYLYAKDIAVHLPRHTFSAVQRKAYMLGLTKGRKQHAKVRCVYPIKVWNYICENHGCTARQISEKTGVSLAYVHQLCKLYRDKAGVMFISGWRRDKGFKLWSAEYTPGHEYNTMRPKEKTGRRRDTAKLLRPYSGNPFGELLRTSDDPKPAPNVHTRSRPYSIRHGSGLSRSESSSMGEQLSRNEGDVPAGEEALC
jgi:hypothetical protein